MKQIFVMDKKNNKKKDAMSGVGGKVKGILSTELAQVATIKVEAGGGGNYGKVTSS